MQPQEPNLALPSWLPWATIACLAALLACASELWIVEKARNRLLREENLLAAAALKGAQNQLEAERILDGRELGEAKASASRAGELRIALLSPPEGTRPEAGSKAPPWGVVVWRGRQLRVQSYLPPSPTPRGFQPDDHQTQGSRIRMRDGPPGRMRRPCRRMDKSREVKG
jgi:hypothetical protein